ncbi:MAG: hypothetical protein AD742_15790 [Methylibium sp. NZG]|nr:MAG: hypothetical protein AD742_15790 [Methylibium sp. NZG]
MFTRKASDDANAVADHAAQSADKAIKSTQRVANESLDGLASSVQDLRNQAAPLLNRVGEQAGAMAQRGVDAVLESSAQLREKALKASDNTVSYIKDEPIKAMLIAAGAGAALMAMLSLMTRSRDR